MEGITVEISPGGTDDTKIVRPAGTIDSSTTTTLESHINKLIALGTRIIVIDFAKVEFVSSAGIGVFLGTVSQLRADGGDLIFMKMPKHIEAVFNIINLQSYFVTINDISDLSTTGSARK